MKHQEVSGKRRGGQEDKKKEGKAREVWRAAQALSLSLSIFPSSLSLSPSGLEMVKAYLRYEEGDAFGVVSAGQARVCYDKSGKLLLVGALEKCLVWNVKQGRCVSVLTAPAPSSGGVRPQVTALAPSPSSSTLVSLLVWSLLLLPVLSLSLPS